MSTYTRPMHCIGLTRHYMAADVIDIVGLVLCTCNLIVPVNALLIALNTHLASLLCVHECVSEDLDAEHLIVQNYNNTCSYR